MRAARVQLGPEACAHCERLAKAHTGSGNAGRRDPAPFSRTPVGTSVGKRDFASRHERLVDVEANQLGTPGRLEHPFDDS